jgi:GNAT superfamily N-acetyltransferase
VYGLASGNYDEPRLLFEERNRDYFISTNKQLLQPEVIHSYLSQSYWAKNRPMWKVQRSIDNSLCFGIYFGKEQVGFCRVVSDCITIAWIADVFVLEPHRGKGLSKWLMQSVMNHPELKDMRRWVLATKDAHDLYAQHGFTGLVRPERWMEKFDENA